MPRKILRNYQCERIKNILPGKVSDHGVTAKHNRLFVETVPWIARTGSLWRDLDPVLRNPLHWILTSGEVADITQPHALIAGLHPQAVVGDKGHDADALVALIHAAESYSGDSTPQQSS